eukprot:CAMPEP_0171589390 /NCGR_PEP_ID=MMETSP0961-20121227/14816_1 /TAXON_ID=87120 /ORGANISM="Aurantiochytrium limacinum, Strain ATCCMYA-1381" /LENGTH=75 /DNA_ID=CAMNT_0012148671 /DNA_START=982 /DNA_END=1205 /DNA_ORIENTATION=-
MVPSPPKFSRKAAAVTNAPNVMRVIGAGGGRLGRKEGSWRDLLLKSIQDGGRRKRCDGVWLKEGLAKKGGRRAGA